MAVDDFVGRYWHLRVAALTPIGNPVDVTVSCNKYLINVRDTDTSDYAEHVRGKQQRIGQVRSAASARHLSVDGGAFNRASVGKGTPGDMVHVLTMGVACGAIQHRGGQAPDQDDVQAWADANLGVDCTGFASAYFISLGVMALSSITNNGCGVFRQSALRMGAFLWNFDDVLPNDVILWMNESGHETRRPGHIAVVYDRTNGRLQCGESSGECDGSQPAHCGPRLKERNWGEVRGAAGSRYLRVINASGSEDQAIVVRPFPPIAPAGTTVDVISSAG